MSAISGESHSAIKKMKGAADNMEGYYTGRISSVDAKRGYVKVTYPRENNIVSDWLPLLSSEYDMPKPGELVATILGKDLSGVCLGKIFSNSQAPPTDNGYSKDLDGVKIIKNDKGVFKIEFNDGGYIRYENGTMTLKANRIKLDGYSSGY